MAPAEVGQTQRQSYDHPNTRDGWGFVIRSSRGNLLFSVTYPDQVSAEAAREAMTKALGVAVEVMPGSRYSTTP